MTPIPQQRGRAKRARSVSPATARAQGATWKRSAQAAVASSIALSAGLGNAAAFAAVGAPSLLPAAGGASPDPTVTASTPAGSASANLTLPLMGAGFAPLSFQPAGGTAQLGGSLPLVGGLLGPPTSTPDDPDMNGPAADPPATPINVSSNATYTMTGAGTSGQESSLLCNVEGATCTHFHGIYNTAGGPDGGPFYRMDANSISVAPCTPQTACYVWDSQLFTYDTPAAKNWQLNFQTRTTFLLGGDGHAALYAELVDDKGNVVTTAYHPELPLPMNRWMSHTESFDGTRLVPGKQYRIRFIFCTLHAESAVSTGHVDIAGPKIVVSGQPGTPPEDACRANTPLDAPPAMQPSAGLDLCPTTFTVGQTIKPLTGALLNVLQSGGVVVLQNKLSGVFLVLRLQAQQLTGWLVGREAIPSLYLSDLVGYLQGGGEGQIANDIVASVLRIPQDALNDLLGGPGLITNIGSLLQGKVGDLGDLLNLNRLLDIPVGESLTKFTYLLNVILTPLLSNTVPSTELGGTIWCDTNQNGILDQGEQPVVGMTVRLKDTSGATIAVAKTDANGRYEFPSVLQDAAPTFYYIEFDRSILAPGTQFTVKYAPGSTHENTSSADQQTGLTQPIETWRENSDEHWNAGIVCGSGGIPCPPAKPTPGIDCPSNCDTGTGVAGSSGAAGATPDASATTQSSPSPAASGSDLTGGLLSSVSGGSGGSPLSSVTGVLTGVL
jgi:hypothetical protein